MKEIIKMTYSQSIWQQWTESFSKEAIKARYGQGKYWLLAMTNCTSSQQNGLNARTEGNSYAGVFILRAKYQL